MNDPIDPLPDDVAEALAYERERADPPEHTQSDLMLRIEGTDQFQVASGLKPNQRKEVSLLAGLRTRAGLVIFLAGTLWGAVLGATAVALIRLPPLPATLAADAGPSGPAAPQPRP